MAYYSAAYLESDFSISSWLVHFGVYHLADCAFETGLELRVSDPGALVLPRAPSFHVDFRRKHSTDALGWNRYHLSGRGRRRTLSLSADSPRAWGPLEKER